MKTFLTIAITAVVTWIVAGLVNGVRMGTDRLWMVSAIKAPGRMAISDIQADMQAGRLEIAAKKMDAFARTWQRFESGPDSCSGLGIGDIMVMFSKIPDTTNVEPGGPAIRSQPIRAETNQASSAAGSVR